MKIKNTVFLLITLVIIICIFILLFYFFSPSATLNNNVKTTQLYLDSFSLNNNGSLIGQIPTDLIITINKNNVIYKKITTLSSGYINITIPQNSLIQIFNSNINNQTFYTSNTILISLNKSQPIRGDIYLNPIGNITVKKYGDFNQYHDNITLQLKSKGEFRDIGFCLNWKGNLLDVGSNLTKIDTPTWLKDKVIQCYTTYHSLLKNNDKYNVTINYKSWGKINNNTQIKVVFLDGDVRYNTITSAHNGMDSYIREYEGKNVGAKDVVYYVEN